MANPVVYGPGYSTYTRTVLLALMEKGQAYDLVEVDLIGGTHKGEEHLARHPFGHVPAFRHHDFELFETDPITRYIDEAFAGPSLEPADVQERARMGQVIWVIGSYAYPAWISKILMQRVVAPMTGGTTDEAVVADAMPEAETCVAVLDRLVEGHEHLVSDELSRADLFLIPVYEYFIQTPEGQGLTAGASNLNRWWKTVRARPSVEATVPSLG